MAYFIAMVLPSWKLGDAAETSPPGFGRMTFAIAESRVAERIASTVVAASSAAADDGGGGGAAANKTTFEESHKHWEHIVESRSVSQLAVDVAAGVSAWRRTAGPITSNPGLGGGISPSERLNGSRYQQCYATMRPAATALELRLVAAMAEELRSEAENAAAAKAMAKDAAKAAESEGVDGEAAAAAPSMQSKSSRISSPSVPYPSAADVRSALEHVPHPDELEATDKASASKAEEEKEAAAKAANAAAVEAARREGEAARLTAAKRRANAAAGSFDVYLSDVTMDSSDEDADDPPPPAASAADAGADAGAGAGAGETKPKTSRLKTNGPSTRKLSTRRPPTSKKLSSKKNTDLTGGADSAAWPSIRTHDDRSTWGLRGGKYVFFFFFSGGDR